MKKKKILNSDEITTVQITRGTLDTMDKVSNGLSRKASINRVYRWLDLQPEIVRAIALGQLHETYTADLVPLPKDEAKC